MAYIKIFGIKSTVKKAVKYITNPNKTDDQKLVSSYACSPETADLEFALIAQKGKDNVMEKGDNLAWHMIISFKPDELSDPDLAHEIGTKIADTFLQGKYQYVLSTHEDKEHIHCHLIFNATNFADYHKYISNKRTYHKICKISNKICQEYGLSPSMPTGEKGKSYKENMEYKRGTSWKAKLKYSVDRAIWSSVTYDEFLLKMQGLGYEIRKGKYLAFRAKDQAHFINVKTLGSYYEEEILLKRLDQNRKKAQIPRGASVQIRMFTEMASYVKNQDSPGFDRWARLHNLQEAAKTFSYLSEHNLLNYEEFQNHISDLQQSIATVDEKINDVQEQIQKQNMIQKHCEIYRACREVVYGEKTALDKNQYRKQHSAEYALHDSTLKELNALGIQKLPSPEKLLQQKQGLEEKLSSVKKEKQDLLKKQKVLHIVENNFEAMLHEAGVNTLTKTSGSKTKETILS